MKKEKGFMNLRAGRSDTIIQYNIEELVRSGKGQKEAVIIAMRKANDKAGVF